MKQKIETVCLAGQHSRPWGVLVDGMLDCGIPRCQHEKAAVLLALLAYPGATVHTTASPEHYSNAIERHRRAWSQRIASALLASVLGAGFAAMLFYGLSA